MGELLFDPAWGTYDMAVGEEVVSVFQGAADKDAFEQISFVPHERTIKVVADETARSLQALYATVRAVRDGREPLVRLNAVVAALHEGHPADWLLPLEVLELLEKRAGDAALAAPLRAALEERAASAEPVAHLVRDGLRLLAS
jgi:phenylalanine-4-hydroxylase